MENKLAKQLTAIEYLTQKINAKHFGGALPSIAITMQGGRAGLENSYGWFWAERWVSKNEKIHELNITAENFDNFLQLVVTLHHELIHLYARVEGKKDTSRQGRYHNMVFDQLCQKFHLSTAKDKRIGTITPLEAQSASYKEWATELMKEEVVDKWLSSGEVFKRLKAEKEDKEEKPDNKYKFECPYCGEKVTLKKDLVEARGAVTCPYCGETQKLEVADDDTEGEGGEDE